MSDSSYEFSTHSPRRDKNTKNLLLGNAFPRNAEFFCLLLLLLLRFGRKVATERSLCIKGRFALVAHSRAATFSAVSALLSRVRANNWDMIDYMRIRCG